eukprot:TRINITY_DN990_c0_g2_i1.p1 TRINITY_DN990_c0_g2~~TRINITY_DN990_c0_g2_i1.p1  ORF type:complete len:548 (+),score=135.90 TRINITY_DN990_c0_g2_i1:101-1744(+)
MMKPGFPGTPKGPKASLSETKSAMQELLGELEHTRKEYAKASLQMTQQETLINHLKDSDAKKDAIIAHLEDELRNQEQLHLQELSVAQEEAKTAQLEADHRIRYLELEVARLKDENVIYTRFEKENRDLRQAVMQQQEQVEKLQQLTEDLKTRNKDNLTDFRSQLEDEFQRRLAEAERQYQAEAYRALSEEARIALQGNDHLQTVLQRQNDSIESVLGRCKQLEASHKKLKLEQDLSQQSLQLQQQEMQRLRKQLGDSKARCAQLEESIKQRRVERASLELLYMEYEANRKEMQRLQDKLRRAQREVERWRHRTLALQEEIGRSVSPQRFQRIQRHTEELRAASEEYTSGRRSRGSRRSRSAGKDSGVRPGWGALSEEETDWETVVEGEKDGGKPKVDPMEILAMWNVNFENYRKPGEPQPQSQQSQSHASQSQSQDAATMDGDIGDGTLPHSAPTATAAGSPLRQPQPPLERKRPKMTTDQERVKHDRNLSVLSKRKFKSLPPQHHLHMAATSHRAADAFPFTVAQGSVHFGAKPAQATQQRFLIP